VIEFQVVGGHLAHPAYGQARVFGAVKGANVFFAALHKVVGELAVEVLIGVGLKAKAGAAVRGGGQLGALFQNLVKQAAVVGRDVFHIGHVFVAAFDFEAAQAHVDEGAQVLALVVVLHGQHMLVVGHDAALMVFDLVGQAAGL
jgi:hypothetical protein